MDLILPTTREQKVRTAEELEAAITEPMRVAPTRDIWIHEDLEDAVRRLWEQTAADLERSLDSGGPASSS